jgi:hypothetical protein
MNYDKTWPLRLRALIKKHLSSNGIMPLPKDFTVSCQILNGKKSIRIRRSPTASESTSKHIYAEFDESPDSINQVLDKVEIMMRQYERIITREEEIKLRGYKVTKPPLEFLEGSPLLAWAYRAREIGTAAFSGTVYIEEGVLIYTELDIFIAGTKIHANKRSLYIKADLSESVISSMKGKPLGSVICFPSCGNEQIDQTLAQLTILNAENTAMPYQDEITACKIEIDEGQVFPMTRKTGPWVSMKPVPLV